MPQTIRAVVVDPAAQGRLAIKPVELRDPDRDEVGVRVTAISLNRGETRRALQVADAGWRPGWDFAGVVETEAAQLRHHLGRDAVNAEADDVAQADVIAEVPHRADEIDRDVTNDQGFWIRRWQP